MRYVQVCNQWQKLQFSLKLLNSSSELRFILHNNNDDDDDDDDDEYMKRIGVNLRLDFIQKTAFLGIAKILRKVLSM